MDRIIHNCILTLCDSCILFPGTLVAHACHSYVTHMCSMTHSYVWHDSFMCVPWLSNQWSRAEQTMIPSTGTMYYFFGFFGEPIYCQKTFFCEPINWHMIFTYLLFSVNIFIVTRFPRISFFLWTNTWAHDCHLFSFFGEPLPCRFLGESCLTYEWVMSHVWMSHVSYMNESCLTYEWVMSHIWVSHVYFFNSSRPIHRWVVSHLWMGHVTHARYGTEAQLQTQTKYQIWIHICTRDMTRDMNSYAHSHSCSYSYLTFSFSLRLGQTKCQIWIHICTRDMTHDINLYSYLTFSFSLRQTQKCQIWGGFG